MGGGGEQITTTTTVHLDLDNVIARAPDPSARRGRPGPWKSHGRALPILQRRFRFGRTHGGGREIRNRKNRRTRVHPPSPRTTKIITITIRRQRYRNGPVVLTRTVQDPLARFAAADADTSGPDLCNDVKYRYDTRVFAVAIPVRSRFSVRSRYACRSNV